MNPITETPPTVAVHRPEHRIRDIENALLRHSAVAEVVVTGKRGDTTAFVRLDRTQIVSPVTSAVLSAYLDSRLNRTDIPQRWNFVDSNVSRGVPNRSASNLQQTGQPRVIAVSTS